jgi:hypothetical protein
MVLGMPLFPMLALGVGFVYVCWPYLSESKRNFPKNVALDTAGFLMDEDVLGGIIFTTGVAAIVGLIGYVGYVIWTGQGGFWPTMAKLGTTEALIFGLSAGMHLLALELYDQEMLGWGGRDDVAERFSVTTFTLANFAFIPIAVSKLALEVTDNRKTATVAGIMALAVSSALTGAVIYEGFFA